MLLKASGVSKAGRQVVGGGRRMFRGMIGNGMVELGVFGGALFAQVKARGRGGLGGG